jgi:membrane-associated protease RseP (regulator of RpoE activity)
MDRAEFDRVDPASVVAKAGIRPGDRIEQIDGRPVRGMAVREFIQSLSRANRVVQLLVDSGSAEGPRKVQVAFPPNYWTWNIDNPPKTGPTAAPRATSARRPAGLRARLSVRPNSVQTL